MFKEKKKEPNDINNYNSNKLYLETLQSESNYIYPTLFKIYNKTGIYYGEIENNKRNGIGKQFNNSDLSIKKSEKSTRKIPAISTCFSICVIHKCSVLLDARSFLKMYRYIKNEPR